MIPWGTDAPIYHWPKATVALILINLGVFFATAGLPYEEQMEWALVRGDGLHPVQWVTSNFMHASLGHVIGNMIFLWAFGIIVEGKLGWLRFLAAYLGIGVVYAAIMQVVSLRAEPGHILGASAIIYGLLAMAVVWAPRNELNCVVFFRFMVSQWDIPILWFAAWYIGWEIVEVALSRMAMSSALLHLTGAILGFLLGTIMVKLDWVDCENWDLYTVLAGRQGQAQAKKKNQSKGLSRRQREAILGDPEPAGRGKKGRAEAASDAKSDGERSAAAIRRVRKLLDTDDLTGADATYRGASRAKTGWKPDEAELMELIKAALVRQAWTVAVPPMRDYCRLFPDRADRIRLKLAQVLVRDLQRPGEALRTLDDIRPKALPPSLEQLRRQLQEQARQMQEEGVLELEGDD
jgi:membrane associated rhomboid family serine protease